MIIYSWFKIEISILCPAQYTLVKVRVKGRVRVRVRGRVRGRGRIRGRVRVSFMI